VPAEPDALTEATEGLFALDPGEFVAARNDLVKALRKAGDRELAASVAELRRPSPAAWAVNQLARNRRDDVENLVGLGRALREAQERALGGADATLLRQAGRARRDAVAALADAAVDILAERGSGADAHTGEITATLEAASLDPAAGEAVLEGRLTSGLDPPSGFGDGAGPTARSQPAQPAPAADETDDRGERLAAAERAFSEATELAASMAEAATAAAANVSDLEGRVGEAEAEVARLERELADARTAAEGLVGELDAARKTAAQATEAATASEQRVTDAQARVDALRRYGSLSPTSGRRSSPA